MKNCTLVKKSILLALSFVFMSPFSAHAEGRSGPVLGGEAIPLQNSRTFTAEALAEAHRRCSLIETESLVRAMTGKAPSEFALYTKATVEREARNGNTSGEIERAIMPYRVIKTRILVAAKGPLNSYGQARNEDEILDVNFEGVGDFYNQVSLDDKKNIVLGLAKLWITIRNTPASRANIAGVTDVFNLDRFPDTASFGLEAIIPGYSFREDIVEAKPSDFGVKVPVKKALTELYLKTSPTLTTRQIIYSTIERDRPAAERATTFSINGVRMRNCLRSEALKQISPK